MEEQQGSQRIVRPSSLTFRYVNKTARCCGGLFCLLVLILAISSCRRNRPEAAGADEVVHNQRLGSKVKTLDPFNVGDSTSSAVCSEFYECLYRYHYLNRPPQLVPNLATEMPQISADGTTYRIPIRRDVYFHNDACFPNGQGRLLTAHDFVYAWKRIANLKTRCENWWIFDGRIVGLDAFRAYTKGCKKGEVDYSRSVAGLYAEDDFTIVIKLHRPWPQLVFWLAHLPTAPMSKEAVDYYGEDIISHPVGTGAFQFKKWFRGVYIEAVRNPTYRRELYPSQGQAGDAELGLLADAGKPTPFIDRVIWRILQEDQPRWYLFMQGEIDINGIPKDNFGQVISLGSELTEDMKSRGIELEIFDEPATFWVGMNMRDPLLGQNRPLRYAISHAIDRERFIELLMNGRGHPAYGFIPPVMKSYDPSIHTTSPSVYDPEKAKEYLKQAEEVNGGPIPQLRLALGGTNTTFRQRGQFLKRNLEKIGLSVTLELYDWPTYLEKLNQSDHQLFYSGWIADYPDAENFLQVFYGKNIPQPNSTGYHNPEFDAIYEKASVLQDSPERTALYRQAQKVLLEDMPSAFVLHRVGYILRHRWLGNVKPDAYHPDGNGYGYLKYYKVDTQQRNEYK